MPDSGGVISLILTIATAIGGLGLLAGIVILAARKLRLFRMEKTTIQMRAIPDLGSRPLPAGKPEARKEEGPENPPGGPGPPRLRDTSVPAWASRVIVLEAPVTTIGRATQNDIVLTEEAVSAEHCRLERRGSEFHLVDLGSTNKTWVNGHEVKDGALRDGDQISVGHTKFVFEWPNGLG